MKLIAVFSIMSVYADIIFNFIPPRSRPMGETAGYGGYPVKPLAFRYIRQKKNLKGEVKMSGSAYLTPAEALERLRTGNEAYLKASVPSGDVSPEIRKKTCREGQSPYAVIVTCSDSRVIPESIFSAGIGELFVVRSAGNVIGEHELGSVEYAVEHLRCPLVVVMGHTHCGAVNAAIERQGHGHVKAITDRIADAIGGETDDLRACVLNVKMAVSVLSAELDCAVTGAVYHIEDGRVEFTQFKR